MHSTMYGGDNNLSDGIKSQVMKLLQQKEMEDESKEAARREMESNNEEIRASISTLETVLNAKIDEVSRHLSSYLEKVADKLDSKYGLMI